MLSLTARAYLDLSRQGPLAEQVSRNREANVEPAGDVARKGLGCASSWLLYRHVCPGQPSQCFIQPRDLFPVWDLGCCMVFSCGLTSHESDRSGGACRRVEPSVVADMTVLASQFDADEYDGGNYTVWVRVAWRTSGAPVWSRPAIHTTGDEAPMLFRDRSRSSYQPRVWPCGMWNERIGGESIGSARETRLGGGLGVGPGRARATKHRRWGTTPHPPVQEGRGQATSIPFRPSTTWLSGCSRVPRALSWPRPSPPELRREQSFISKGCCIRCWGPSWTNSWEPVGVRPGP